MDGAFDPWYPERIDRDAGRRSDPTAPWREWWAASAQADAVGRRAAGSGFVLTGRELAELGVTRSRIRTNVRRERWVQAGRGFVAPVDIRADLPKVGSGHAPERRRHALASSAATRARPDAAAACRSAAVLHGLPTFRVPVEAELLTREVGAGCRPAGHLYTAKLGRDETTEWYGRAVTTVARTLVDLARHDRFDAIMAADAALRAGLTDERGIDAALRTAIGWPGVRQARALLALADPRAESPLESVTRLRLHDDDLPAPEPQVWIGPYRVDFYWARHGLVLEADGRVKYDADERWAEKLREQALRRLGVVTVERVIWDDVLTGWPATSRRLHTLLR